MTATPDDGVAPPAIATARLRLVAASAETAAADGADALSLLLGAAVPSDYDTADVKDVMPGYAESLQDDRACLGWGPWFIVARDRGALVGNLGFHGPATAGGVVELGYEVFAEFRGLGFVTEALRALLHWAFARGVRLATARCEPANAASIAVLRKAGLVRIEEGDVWRWELAAGRGATGNG